MRRQDEGVKNHAGFMDRCEKVYPMSNHILLFEYITPLFNILEFGLETLVFCKIRLTGRVGYDSVYLQTLSMRFMKESSNLFNGAIHLALGFKDLKGQAHDLDMARSLFGNGRDNLLDDHPGEANFTSEGSCKPHKESLSRNEDCKISNMGKEANRTMGAG